MFLQILIYEWKYWLKNPALYLYFISFWAIAFILFAGTAGFFDPAAGPGEADEFLNAPYAILSIIQFFTPFFAFLLPAVVGNSIYRDYQYRAHSILYAYPLHKGSYLFGKFCSAFVVVVLITIGVALAFIIAEHLPGLRENRVGPFRLIGYIEVYSFYVLPNLFIIGAVVFTVVLISRNIYAGFAAVLVLILVRIIIENALVNHLFWLGLFDPFGKYAHQYLTRSWTLAEQNSKALPIYGLIIWNRILWLGVGGATLALGYRLFSFSENITNWFTVSQRAKTTETLSKKEQPGLTRLVVVPEFTFSQRMNAIWHITQTDLGFVLRSMMFWLLAGFGVVAFAFMVLRVTYFNEIAILPVTRVILWVPTISYNMILLFLTFLFAGMIVHRARMVHMHLLLDVTPNPSWGFLSGKVLSIAVMQIILLNLPMGVGIGIQQFYGYGNHEIPLYLFHLYVLLFPVLMIWNVVTVFVYTLLPNFYLGLFLLILGWLGVMGLPEAGITSRLIPFNNPPALYYSDLNGYGEMLRTYGITVLYWLIWGGMITVLAYLFWLRGMEHTLGQRLKKARIRMNKAGLISLSLLLVVILSLGAIIYNAEQHEMASNSSANWLARFQNKFQKYQHLPQPKISRVQLNLDLFPKENNFLAEGTYTLINKSARTVDTLMVKTGFDEITTFRLDRGFTTVAEDSFLKFAVLKLQRPLFPRDSLKLEFKVENLPNTLFQRNSNVLNNGTFLREDILPRIGYFYGDNRKSSSDTMAWAYNYQAIDADYVHLDATISTSADQIVVAPGKLLKEWTTDGRHHFQYRTDRPIKFNFAINSGKFAVKTDRWQQTGLEIYYHPTHEYNLERMMDGLKAALEYNSKYFGAYQHQQMRIVEFPQSEGTYATTAANTIQMSEIRFIANPGVKTDKIDLSFYVPAHELTHQWWGNQLMPAATRGAEMLTESITEYLTLKIFEKQYGTAKALRFLKLQRARYLEGRKKETGKEPPLIYVEPEQEYLSYGKGTLAFNTLGYYWGEENLNTFLGNFLQDYKFKGPPYPTAGQLIERLRAVTPDSLQYLIEDMFETVTIYNNELETVVSKPLSNGKNKVEITFSVRKYRDEEKISPFGYLEIGCYDNSGRLLKMVNYKTAKEKNQISIELEGRPATVVLDPNILLIDKNLTDNERFVK